MATAPAGKTWQTGVNASSQMESGYTAESTDSNVWHGHTGMLEYYLPKFYAYARGHVLNKYHVGLYGPYVDEALRVMDRNSWADKYNLTSEKTFTNKPGEHYKHDEFMDWLELCYDKSSGILNMLWAAKSVTVPGAKAATPAYAMLDSTKSMAYPVITKVNQPENLQLTIIDDPYLMWYNFFNALFNVQFSPLVLKPRSTLQKINVMVDLYYEGITTGASKSTERLQSGWSMTSDKACITDLQVGQMFEFNSCVLTAAPQVKMDYNGSVFEFNASFAYPNSFQGSFKDTFRYLRDNTTRGVDNNDSTSKPTTKATSVYGEYNKGFYEETYKHVQAEKSADLYEAFQKNDYKSYMKTKNAAFSDITYHYDMNGNRKK